MGAGCSSLLPDISLLMADPGKIAKESPGTSRL
jgi:hypothetical protein